MDISVHNKAHEVHQTQKGQFCGRVVDIEINGVKIETPKPVPTTRELEYCTRIDRSRLDLSVVQYVRQLKRLYLFQNQYDKEREKSSYNAFLQTNNSSVVDFFFQYPHRFNLSDTQQAMLMQLQNETNSKFVSYFERNRNQPADVFEKEIIALRDEYDDKIFTPTISMKTEKEGLIKEKIKRVLDNKFQRVNVIYASIRENPVNWFDLSALIYDKDLWVNVVNVLPRMVGNEKTATIPWTFLFGVNTASLAKPWGGSPAYPRRLNRTTSCFDIIDESISYQQSRVENIIESEVLTQDLKDSILEENLFSDFVGNKTGLTRIITDLS